MCAHCGLAPVSIGVQWNWNWISIISESGAHWALLGEKKEKEEEARRQAEEGEEGGKRLFLIQEAPVYD